MKRRRWAITRDFLAGRSIVGIARKYAMPAAAVERLIRKLLGERALERRR
jgi:Mor family transcriptional regulator